MHGFPFPTFHAILNLVAAGLLVAGYGLIRRKQIGWHRRAMLGAFAVSVLFLASYVAYHARAGTTSYEGQGWLRQVYFAILISHSILAAVVPLLAVVTLWRGLRGQYDRHRAIARWTLPIWLYVNLTGVLIYGMLYLG